MSLNKISHVRANNLDFAYHEVGEGPLVLCFHGFPDTAKTWFDLMPALASAGYRVVAPYMRGYAPTQVPGDHDFRVWTLGQDVLALIEALGEERAIVIGHDWGASTVYSAEAQGAEHIERLIALAIPPPAALRPSLSTLWAIRHFITFQRKRATLSRYRADPGGFLREIYERWSPAWDLPEEELEPTLECFEQPGTLESAFGYYWALMRGITSSEMRTLNRAKVTTPSLLIGGNRDILDVSIWDNVSRAFDAPCEVAIIDGAGHFLHREKPAEVNDVILGWLQAP